MPTIIYRLIAINSFQLNNIFYIKKNQFYWKEIGTVLTNMDKHTYQLSFVLHISVAELSREQ